MTAPDLESSASTSVRPGEWKRVALAFAAFFLLLSSYYILRPVRDEMGVQTGAEKLPWLFTGTFIATLLTVPLFGWVVRRAPRARVLPYVYGFFALNLIAFLVVFTIGVSPVVAATFFVWLSVFNLCVVSLFWSNVSDVFTSEEARRLYGRIAAGGTAGALAGPALTAALATHVPTAALIALSAFLLLGSTACCIALRRISTLAGEHDQRAVGGGIVAGIRLTLQSPTLRRVALLVIFYTTVSTVLYVEQNAAVKATFASSGERTAFFATVDLIVNCVALALQLVGTGRLVSRFGLRFGLGLVPLLVTLGLAIAGAWRTVIVLAVLQIIHRAGEYAFVRPAREMIYTTVDAESRFKGKNFIDTTVYRSNDVLSAWLVDAIRAGGHNALLFLGIPAGIGWLASGLSLGGTHDRERVIESRDGGS